MLFQARHDLDEVAWTVAVIELPLQDAVPSVFAGPRRTREAENIGPAGDTAASP